MLVGWYFIKEFIVSKNKEPIVLPKEKIRGTYITVDTIHVPIKDSISVDAYRLIDTKIKLQHEDRDYLTEQFIYRITGVCCEAYDSPLVRACLCLSKHICCATCIGGKGNCIVLPESKILHPNIYWITVFELVYKLKYPQSNNTNKCLVYALNCMLKSGMLTLDNFVNATNICSHRHFLLSEFSLSELPMLGNVVYLPRSVYRYYTRFGKRLKRRYKKDQMPGGKICCLSKIASLNAIAEYYTNEICKCIQLNPPIDASDNYANTVRRRSPKAYFADARPTRNNSSGDYKCLYLYLIGRKSTQINVYTSVWMFVNATISDHAGCFRSDTHQIELASAYGKRGSVVENAIKLQFTLYHEYAHGCHWRAMPRWYDVDTRTSHYNRKRGATYEHQAHKFAVWCLLMHDVSIITLVDAFTDIFGTTVCHSHEVILRYCKMLAYVLCKYGKLCIPPDLGYVFVNNETRKLYKPNDEIKSITKAGDN